MKKAIKQSDTVLREIIKKAVDEQVILSISNLKGEIIYINKMFCRIYQYKKDEVIGKSHRIINSKYHDKVFYKNLWDTILSGKIWRGELRNKAKDGSIHWAQAKIVPVVDDNKKPLYFIALRFIITDKKLLEEERNAYYDELQKLLHKISHEVRKPVTTCLGLLEQLDNQNELSLKEQKLLFKYMQQTGKEMDKLTRELTLYIYNLEQKSKKLKSLKVRISHFGDQPIKT